MIPNVLETMFIMVSASLFWVQLFLEIDNGVRSARFELVFELFRNADCSLLQSRR